MLDKSFNNWLTIHMKNTDTDIQTHLTRKQRAYLQTMCREAGVTDSSSMSMKQMQNALTHAERNLIS